METNPVKILMADDDPDDLELMEDALLAQIPTAQLLTFTDAQSALEYLVSAKDSELPCLVVLDYNMPDMTGAEVLSHLQTEQRFLAIPKVIVSTSDAPPNVMECMNNGAAEYFVKPSSVSGLQSLAKKLLSFCDPISN